MQALVPRTRSSHSFAANEVANFGFKSGTRIIELLVSRFRSSHQRLPQGFANFGIGTRVGISVLAVPAGSLAAKSHLMSTPGPVWSLHPQLACDTAPIGDLALSRVLVMNDASYPWVILVPRV